MARCWDLETCSTTLTWRSHNVSVSCFLAHPSPFPTCKRNKEMTLLQNCSYQLLNYGRSMLILFLQSTFPTYPYLNYRTCLGQLSFGSRVLRSQTYATKPRTWHQTRLGQRIANQSETDSLSMSKPYKIIIFIITITIIIIMKCHE